MENTPGSTDELRELATKRVHAKRGFYNYLGIWAAVSVMLTVIWALSGMGYFWPIWAIFGMGVAALFQFIGIFVRKPVTSSDIDREMDKLSRT